VEGQLLYVVAELDAAAVVMTLRRPVELRTDTESRLPAGAVDDAVSGGS
jgi:hypothetical protein